MIGIMFPDCIITYTHPLGHVARAVIYAQSPEKRAKRGHYTVTGYQYHNKVIQVMNVRVNVDSITSIELFHHMEAVNKRMTGRVSEFIEKRYAELGNGKGL